LTNFNRLVIGCAALSPVPVSKIADYYQISRNYVYILRDRVSQFIHDPFQSRSEGMNIFCQISATDNQIITASNAFYEKMVVFLILDGSASEEGIQRILENNFGKHISIGRISQILNQTADHAAEFDASIDLSGIPKAFPDAVIQPALFHWLMELGKEVSSQKRKAYFLLSDYYQCEDALNGQRIHEKTFQKLLKLEEKLGPALDRCDTLQILYGWLKEMTCYNGYGYPEVVSLCSRILDRMEGLAGETSSRLAHAISKTRKNLPNVLVYLERAEKTLRDYAVKHGYPPEAFVLLYKMSGYQSGPLEYQRAYRRLCRLLRRSYADCYLKVQEILDGIKRTSSLVENLNGRLRPYMNLKRMVPEKFLTLLKVYFNTKNTEDPGKQSGKGKAP